MIRILHYGLGENLGGIETYLYKLSQNINRNIFKFDFLVIGSKKPCFYDNLKALGSNFYYVTPRSKNIFRNKKEITELFNREKFDVLHAHMNTLSYITPVIEALKSGCKVIVHSRSAGMAGSKTTNMLHQINSYLLPGDRIEKLAVSDLAGWWLFGKKADFKVIYNGIDLELYRFDPELRRKTRSSLGLSNQYTVIHVGAMRPLKNHFFLLDLFKEVAERKEGSKLILVGEGSLKEDILKKINSLGLQDNVMLLGNRIDIPQLLSAADSFIFPSHFEGFPNAVLEAQATGLPCLISDNITSDVIINSNCFSYSLNLTPNLWADALLKLNVLENRQIAVENLAQKGFSVKDEVCKIEDIYNNLLQ